MKNYHQKTKLAFAALAFSALALSGCSIFIDAFPDFFEIPDYKAVQEKWQSGDLAGAFAEIQKDATPEAVENSKSSILWELNSGVISSFSGAFADSSAIFDSAMARAKAGFIKEEENLDAGTAISRWWSSEYEATQQEVNTIPIYQIFNSFRDNAPANDIVGTARSVLEVQERAEAIHKKRIVAQIQSLEKTQTFGNLDKTFASMHSQKTNNGEYDKKEEISQIEKDLKKVYGKDFQLNFKAENPAFVSPETAIFLNAQFQKINPDSLDFKRGAALSTVANPFAAWLASAILLADANTEAELETVRALRRNAVEISQGKSEFLNNAFVKICKNDLSKTTNTTYVIYEGGRAPEVMTVPVKIRIPANVHAMAAIFAKFGHAKMPPKTAVVFFPKVRSRGSVPELIVNGNKTEPVVDFEAMVDAQFRAEAVAIAENSISQVAAILISRGVTLVATKIAFEAAKKVKKDNKIVFEVAKTAYDVARKAMGAPIELDRPDTRHWEYLPRTFEVAQMPTPADGKLSIFSQEYSVPAGVNFVRVRKDNSSWTPVVQVFAFPQDNAPGIAAGGDDEN